MPKMSLKKRSRDLQFSYLGLISHHYYAYVNVFMLLCFSVFEFSSVCLTLVRFTLTKNTGVPKNYVLIKVD